MDDWLVKVWEVGAIGGISRKWCEKKMIITNGENLKWHVLTLSIPRGLVEPPPLWFFIDNFKT